MSISNISGTNIDSGVTSTQNYALTIQQTTMDQFEAQYAFNTGEYITQTVLRRPLDQIKLELNTLRYAIDPTFISDYPIYSNSVVYTPGNLATSSGYVWQCIGYYIFQGSLSGNTLTVTSSTIHMYNTLNLSTSSAITSGSVFSNGVVLYGTGITSNTIITANGTGTGLDGTYVVNNTYGTPVSASGSVYWTAYLVAQVPANNAYLWDIYTPIAGLQNPDNDALLAIALS